MNDESDLKGYRGPPKSDWTLNGRRGDPDLLTEEQRSNVGRIMKMARRAKRYTQAQVAVAASSTPQAIGLWEQGKNSTSAARLNAIGKFLDIDIDAAKFGKMRPSPFGTASPEAAAIIPAIDPALNEDWMSVLGTEQLDDGAFALGLPISQIRRPPGLRQSKMVAALNVASDNMYPRFRLGELIYVQRRIAGVGDDAVIELHTKVEGTSSKAYLGEVAKSQPSKLYCHQHNPAEQLSFDRTEIKHIWRILTVPDLLGR